MTKYNYDSILQLQSFTVFYEISYFLFDQYEVFSNVTLPTILGVTNIKSSCMTISMVVKEEAVRYLPSRGHTHNINNTSTSYKLSL
jgi:hypothetical protein